VSEGVVEMGYCSLHVTCNMVIAKLHTCVKLIGGPAYVMIKKEKILIIFLHFPFCAYKLFANVIAGIEGLLLDP
jgi:hypothetical protein